MIDSEILVRVCRRLLLCFRPPGATPAAKSARNFLHLAVLVPVHLRTPHDQRTAEPWGIATGRICSNGFERRGLSCWRAVLQSSHTWLLPHVMVAASAIYVMLLQSWLWRQAESAEDPEGG